MRSTRSPLLLADTPFSWARVKYLSSIYDPSSNEHLTAAARRSTARSAPLNPSVRAAIFSHIRSKTGESLATVHFIRLMCKPRMDILSCLDGRPTCTTRSKRPGRTKAVSTIHGVVCSGKYNHATCTIHHILTGRSRVSVRIPPLLDIVHTL